MKDVKNKSYPRKKLAIVISTLVILCFLQISLNSYAESPTDAVSNDFFWGWRFLGRLHPIAVHFPVSLLLLNYKYQIFINGQESEPHFFQRLLGFYQIVFTKKIKET